MTAESVTDTAGVQRFTLPLDLAGDAAAALRTTLLGVVEECRSPVLEVDACDVEQLDIPALAVLVAAQRRARARGIELHVVHPNWLMTRLLRETALDRVLYVVVDPFTPRPWFEVS